MGQILLDTVAQTFGNLPMPAEAVPVFGDTDPNECLRYCESRAQALDEGDGLIIFTDICGATPDNIAKRLSSDTRIVISGLSLPMLFRVCNNPTLSLEVLSQKAVSGGHDGIICL
jgi:PTS system ascorbate-specific IIA component